MKEELDIMEVKNRIRNAAKRSEYEDGLNTEIEMFPQAGIIYAKDLPHEYNTPLQERIWLKRVREELRSLRRGKSA